MMERNKVAAFGLWLVMLVAACSSEKAPPPRGSFVGNGGDPIQVRFTEGKARASEWLRHLPRNTPPPYPGTQISRPDWSWLVSRGEKIAEDILASRHVWSLELPQDRCPYSTCGCTDPDVPAAPIYLSLSACPRTVHDRDDAAVTLFHESLHHFLGKDEERINRLVSALRDYLRQSGVSTLPRWKRIKSLSRAFTLGGWEPRVNRLPGVWTGSSFVIWWDKELMWLDPGENKWTLHGAKNSYVPWYREGWADGVPGEWVNGEIVSLSHCARAIRRKGAGETYDPASHTWRLVTETGAPSDRKMFSRIVVDDSVLLWGGITCETSPRTLNDGSIYHPSSDRWEPLPPADFLAGRIEPALAWSGKELFLWGGSGLGWNQTFPDGAIYHLDTKSWERLPNEGAPEGLSSPKAFWTGETFLVYGSYERKGSRFSGGALYDPRKRVWSPLADAGGPDAQLWGPDLSLSTAWLGDRLLVRGQRVAFLYPGRGEWQAPDIGFSPTQMGREQLIWTGNEVISWDPYGKEGYFLYP